MATREEWTIREIYAILQSIYTKTYGIEYIHMASIEEKHWIEVEMQRLASHEFTKEVRTKTWTRLARAHLFNEFLKTRFTTSKRFGIEGIDTLVIGLDAIVDEGAA